MSLPCSAPVSAAPSRNHRVPALQQDVLRLDVPVNHVMTVRVAQRVRDLAGDLKRIVQGKLLLAREPRPERLPFHIRHDVVEEAARLARVVDRQNVGVGQTRRGLDLAQEPPGADL